MSTAAAKKRIEKIEDKLTPKEWAIRLADEIRQHPSLSALCTAQIKSGESTVHRAHEKLIEQAEARHPGRSAHAEQRADVKRTQVEFGILTHLILQVNETVARRIDCAGTEVALKLQTLQTIILQDGFGQTARKVSAWIKGQKATGQSKDATRQEFLGELAAYATHEDATGFRFTADVWVDAISALVFDLRNHKAAVGLLQDTYFDGHAMLALDAEAELGAIIQVVRQTCGQFNEYLAARGSPNSPLTIDIDALGSPTKAVKSLADYWLTLARDEATIEVLNWMGDVAKRDAYRHEMVKRMLGLTGHGR